MRRWAASQGRSPAVAFPPSPSRRVPCSALATDWEVEVRIAQIAPLAEAVPPKLYGGTERVIWWLTEALVHQGHDVTLFASGDSRTSARLVPCVPTGLRLAGINDQVASLIAMLDRVLGAAGQFDILHFHVDFLHFPVFRHLA